MMSCHTSGRRWDGHRMSLPGAKTYSTDRNRRVKLSTQESRQDIFPGHVSAVADVWSSLREQASAIRTTKTASQAACVIVLFICGALEWLQGPVRSLVLLADLLLVLLTSAQRTQGDFKVGLGASSAPYVISCCRLYSCHGATA